MVLVDCQIKERVDSSSLIDSFSQDHLTNIGYDLRAKNFYTGKEAEESITLQPYESAFVESVEVVTMPVNLIGRVVLKNSRIRQGFSMDAPVYQPGHKTRIYFRITNFSADAITLYRGESYVTILFEELGATPDHPYEGTFRDEFNFRGLGDYKDVYKRQVREIEKKTDDLKSMESSIYANVLVILSVFVALFTLITTNVSLVASCATVEMYFIFNAILLGCISFLAALLKTFLSSKKCNWAIWIPSVICFAVALLLFLF